MGTWGIEPFNNDAALDWEADLLRTVDSGLLRSTLELIASGAGFLIGSEGEVGIAAIATFVSIATANSEMVTDEIADWIKDRHPRIEPGDQDLARRAAARVLGPESDLPALWAENEKEGARWREIAEELQRVVDEDWDSRPAR